MLVSIDLSRDSFRSPVPKDEMPPDKGNSTSDSGVVKDVKMNTIEGKNYQPESNADSSAL